MQPARVALGATLMLAFGPLAGFAAADDPAPGDPPAVLAHFTCEGFGAYYPVEEARVRPLVDPAFTLALGGSGLAVVGAVFVTCDFHAMDGVDGGPMDYSVLFAVLEDTSRSYDLVEVTNGLLWHERMAFLGVESHFEPGVSVDVERVAGSSVGGRATVPWDQGAFGATAHVASRVDIGQPFPSYHWVRSTHGHVFSEHDNTFIAGGEALVTLEAEPDGAAHDLLGFERATMPGLWLVYEGRAVYRVTEP